MAHGQEKRTTNVPVPYFYLLLSRPAGLLNSCTQKSQQRAERYKKGSSPEGETEGKRDVAKEGGRQEMDSPQGRVEGEALLPGRAGTKQKRQEREHCSITPF